MSMVTEEHGETYGTNKWKINRKRLNIKVLSSLPYEEGDLFGHNAMRCCGTLLCPAVAHGVFYKNTLSTNHMNFTIMKKNTCYLTNILFPFSNAMVVFLSWPG